jgi:tetratricopeptide (TPR) repeat protein
MTHAGEVMDVLELFEDSAEYWKMAVRYLLSSEHLLPVGYCLYRVGRAFYHLRQYSDALINFDKAISIYTVKRSKQNDIEGSKGSFFEAQPYLNLNPDCELDHVYSLMAQIFESELRLDDALKIQEKLHQLRLKV